MGGIVGIRTYCYDLAIDPDELRGLSDAELAARLARSPRPLRKVKKNAAPCLCPLGEAPAELLGDVSPAEFIRRARLLRSDRALIERLVAAANAGEATYPPSPYVERQIYDGFWSDADARKLEAFHRASWEERVVIANNLEDPRLVWLARRLIFVEQPHLLAPEHHAAMAAEKAGRMMAVPAGSGGWTTLSRAGDDLAAMLLGMDEETAAPFIRLQGYIAARREDADHRLGA